MAKLPLDKDNRPSFVEQLNKWKKETGGLTQEEYIEFENLLKRNKEQYPYQNQISLP